MTNENKEVKQDELENKETQEVTPKEVVEEPVVEEPVVEELLELEEAESEEVQEEALSLEALSVRTQQDKPQAISQENRPVKQVEQNPKATTPKNRLIASALASVVIFAGIGGACYYLVTDKEPKKEDTQKHVAKGEVHTVPLPPDYEPSNYTEDGERKYLSTLSKDLLEDEEVVGLLEEYEDTLNSLAVGFTTMASFLEQPESIPNIEDIQKEFGYSTEAYNAILTGLHEFQGTEKQKEFTTILHDRYKRMYNYRKYQIDNLVDKEGVTQVNYKDTKKEEITAFWSEIVNMHRDFEKVTGLDYTGGLGALMR